MPSHRAPAPAGRPESSKMPGHRPEIFHQVDACRIALPGGPSVLTPLATGDLVCAWQHVRNWGQLANANRWENQRVVLPGRQQQ